MVRDPESTRSRGPHQRRRQAARKLLPVVTPLNLRRPSSAYSRPQHEHHLAIPSPNPNHHPNRRPFTRSANPKNHPSRREYGNTIRSRTQCPVRRDATALPPRKHGLVLLAAQPHQRLGHRHPAQQPSRNAHAARHGQRLPPPPGPDADPGEHGPDRREPHLPPGTDRRAGPRHPRPARPAAGRQPGVPGLAGPREPQEAARGRRLCHLQDPVPGRPVLPCRGAAVQGRPSV